MLRLLHCADLHLEASFSSEPLPISVTGRRRAGLRSALARVIALARERQVDAVTIAGDLYEQELTALDTAQFLEQQLASLAPIRVFVAPGECDPHVEGSLYALTRWPANVTIFPPGRLSAVELAPGIRLWGAACPPAPGRAGWEVQPGARGSTNLLLLHAAWAGPATQGLYGVDEAALRGAGIRLALLGHEHSGRTWREGDVTCIYPGSPEPLAPGEAGGEHQAVLVAVEGATCTPEGIALGQWRYRELGVDISGCSSPEEAAVLVAASLRKAPEPADEHTLCRVTLTGRRRFDLDVAAMQGQVKGPAHVQYEIRLPPAYDLAELAGEPTVRSLLVRRFQDRMARARGDAERSLALGALNLALRALDGRQVRRDETG